MFSCLIKTVNKFVHNQVKEREEEECTMIFMLVHPNHGLYPVLTLQYEISLT